MIEYGIFDDQAADYSAYEALEAGFYSKAEAVNALRVHYSEDLAHVHEVEEPDEDGLDNSHMTV